VSTVLDQAQNFSGGPIAAARKRDRWARQEANATDDADRMAYGEAIADLEARYPDIAEVPIGGAEAFARARGYGSSSRSPTHQGRSRLRPPKDSAPAAPAAKPSSKPESKPTPGLDPTARRKTAPRGRAKRSPTPRVDRAIRQTGIPAATSSAGGVVMAAIGGTVSLGLLFLVLDSSEKKGPGHNALPTVFSAVSKAVHRFLSLEDFFSPPSQGRVLHTGEAAYNEAPGSDVAVAAQRLKAAGKAPPHPRLDVGGRGHYRMGGPRPR
jgi:hypothetical protein